MTQSLGNNIKFYDLISKLNLIINKEMISSDEHSCDQIFSKGVVNSLKMKENAGSKGKIYCQSKENIIFISSLFQLMMTAAFKLYQPLFSCDDLVLTVKNLC